MKPITIKVVFDRKKEADNKTKKGLVQIRVTCERKQVFFTTGIKVFKNQWDSGKERVKRFRKPRRPSFFLPSGFY